MESLWDTTTSIITNNLNMKCLGKPRERKSHRKEKAMGRGATGNYCMPTITRKIAITLYHLQKHFVSAILLTFCSVSKHESGGWNSHCVCVCFLFLFLLFWRRGGNCVITFCLAPLSMRGTLGGGDECCLRSKLHLRCPVAAQCDNNEGSIKTMGLGASLSG